MPRYARPSLHRRVELVGLCEFGVERDPAACGESGRTPGSGASARTRRTRRVRTGRTPRGARAATVAAGVRTRTVQLELARGSGALYDSAHAQSQRVSSGGADRV